MADATGGHLNRPRWWYAVIDRGSHTEDDARRLCGACPFAGCSDCRWQGGASASTVAAAAGISYRQLDHWIRQGWLPGGEPGKGCPRVFTCGDARRVVALADLVHAGFLPSVAVGLAEVFLQGADRAPLGRRFVLVDEGGGGACPCQRRNG